MPGENKLQKQINKKKKKKKNTEDKMLKVGNSVKIVLPLFWKRVYSNRK